MDVSWEVLEDILNLLLESSGEHFIGLVEDEQLEVVGLKVTFLHHVVDSSWGSNDDVDTLFQNVNVFLDDGSSDARMDLDVAVFSERLDDNSDLDGQLSGGRDDEGLAVVGFGVDGLESSNGESSSFSSSGLSLSNRVFALNDGKNSLLLDGGWLLETITKDTSQDFFSESQVFKFID